MRNGLCQANNLPTISVYSRDNHPLFTLAKETVVLTVVIGKADKSKVTSDTNEHRQDTFDNEDPACVSIILFPGYELLTSAIQNNPRALSSA